MLTTEYLRFMSNRSAFESRYILACPVTDFEEGQIVNIFGRLYLIYELDKKYFLKPLDGSKAFEYNVQWLLDQDWLSFMRSLHMPLSSFVYNNVPYIMYTKEALIAVLNYFASLYNLALSFDGELSIDNTTEQ